MEIKMKSPAYEIADQLVAEVQERYPHLRGDGLTTMALLRACDLLSGLYSPESTDRLPGKPHGNEGRSEGDIPTPSLSRGRRELAGSFSGYSPLTCPNCEYLGFLNERQNSFVCTNCGYAEERA